MTDGATAFPVITLMNKDDPQGEFIGLRWLARRGRPLRRMHHDLPPWLSVRQQARRPLRARWFETMLEDLRGLLPRFAARHNDTTIVGILVARTIPSTAETGGRAA
jgi:hypothetical protein